MEEFANGGVPFNGRWETFRDHFKLLFISDDSLLLWPLAKLLYIRTMPPGKNKKSGKNKTWEVSKKRKVPNNTTETHFRI
jgi:hypothetical protein